MDFNVILGLVLLFFIYRAIRGVLKSLSAAAPNVRKNGQAQNAPAPSVPPTPAYRGPRDTTARPAMRSSVPRAVLRMKSSMTAPAAQKPMQTSGSPFIIQSRRRFPLVGILAVATIIVLISSCYAWINETPQRPAPGRNAALTIHMTSVA